MMTKYLPVLAADADMWAKEGLPTDEEEQIIIALWRYYRGRPDASGLSMMGRLIYAPIIRRWEALEKQRKDKSRAGRLGGMRTQENNRFAKAGALTLAQAGVKAEVEAGLLKPSSSSTATTSTISSSKKEIRHKGDTPLPPGVSHSSAKFQRPTVDAIREFCETERLNVDPEAFFNYYEANGWKVGKSPMRNWEAAARNWDRRNVGNEKTNTPRKEPKREYSHADWLLCEERCAKFWKGKCVAGINTPPQLNPERKHPPEECACFAAFPPPGVGTP